MARQYIRATDLDTLTACDRQVYLDHHGDPALRLEPPGFQQWLARQGQDFEAEVASRFAVREPAYSPGDLEGGFRATLDLMRRGVPVIYRGVLLDGDIVAIPDLMVRVEGRSRLGDHYYRPIDIKLATEAREGHRLQVMVCVALLEAIQGVRPEGGLFLRLPPGERTGERLYREEPVIYDERVLNERLAEARELVGGYEPEPFISSTCNSCAWHDVCLPIAEQSQDVSLLPGIQRRVWRGLHEHGLGTLGALTSASVEQLLDIRGVGEKTAVRLIRQAQALTGGQMIYVARPDLPEPASTEVFFDVESVPIEGLYYLMGLLVRRGDRYVYEPEIARRPEDEPAMWAAFLEHMDRLDGPVYHYGQYERATITSLAGRYGDGPRAQALLDRMVDLHRVLGESVVLPLHRYSLKDVAPWLGFAWSGETQCGDDSILEYLHWLETGDEQHLQRILIYNEDDLRATLTVRDWLLRVAKQKR